MTDPQDLRAIVAAWWQDTFADDYVIDGQCNYRTAEDCIEEIVIRARAALTQAEPEGPTPQPIPVSERLPEPKDCDAKGRCWIGRSEYTFPMGDTGSWGHADPEWCLEKLCEVANSTNVWLPAHALPLPF